MSSRDAAPGLDDDLPPALPSMWRKFCAVLGLAIADDPDFATGPARLANSARLTALIQAVTATDTAAAWIEKFNAAGIPCGPVYTMDQVFADPQVEHLGIAQPVPSRVLGELRQVRQPLDFSRTSSALWTGAPELGEQTDEVLADYGFSADEIAALHRCGAV